MANIKSIIHKRFRINTTDSIIIIRWLKIYWTGTLLQILLVKRGHRIWTSRRCQHRVHLCQDFRKMAVSNNNYGFSR
jgi:hypothetical protein